MSASLTSLALVKYRAKNLVGGARVDIVGADQIEAFLAAAIRAHEIIHCRRRLLVNRGPGVDDILGAFLTLILDRVEQEAIILLEHRKNRFTAYRRPATKNRCYLILLKQLLGFFREEIPVRSGVFNDSLYRSAEDTTGFVNFIDGHQHDLFDRCLADRHGAAQ